MSEGKEVKRFLGLKRGTRDSALSVCVGVGLLLGWMMSLLVRGGVMSGPFPGERSSAFDPFYLAAMLAAGVTCLGFCLPLRFPGKILLGRPFVAFVSVLAFFAAAGTVAVGVVPVTSVVLCWVLGALVGVCLSVLLMVWLLILTNFDPGDTVTILLLDIVIALFAYLVTHLSQKVLHLPLLTTAITVALLLASTFFLLRSREYLADVNLTPSETSPLLAKLGIFAFVSCLAIEYANAYLVVQGQGRFFLGNYDRFIAQMIGVLFCVVVVVVLAVVLRRENGRPGHVVTRLYRIISYVIACGLVLCVYGAGGLHYATDAVLLLARVLAFIGTWAIALHAVFLYGRDVVGLIGTMLMAQFFGSCGGFALHSQVIGLGEPLLAQGVVVVTLLVFCFVTLFVFTDLDASATGRVSVVGESREGKTLEERCHIARERFGLTERETEVLQLLASGRNAVTVQKALCVSYNTVKVHKRNIYMKLDVHSQQDLLNLMDRLS